MRPVMVSGKAPIVRQIVPFAQTYVRSGFFPAEIPECTARLYAKEKIHRLISGLSVSALIRLPYRHSQTPFPSKMRRI
jgi:hypothetical protein